MNNSERGAWIDNDEYLYRWWLSEKVSKELFIKRHRKTIDIFIEDKLGPKVTKEMTRGLNWKDR